MADLRLAVIGAGVMGGNHARVAAGLPGVTLAYVCDADPARAADLAARWNAAPAALETLPGRIDAAIIASSSSTHADIGSYLLSHGIPCLIEKPLAVSREECARLMAAAAQAGVPVAVGHVERFNPAILATLDLLRGHGVQMVEARRLNPGSARILDTDVVIDLMVHDLDVVQALMGGAPQRISAMGFAAARPGVSDHATALLGFGGAMATVTASRATRVRVRALLIESDLGVVAVNYLTRSVTLTRSAGAEAEDIPVPAGEPLALEQTRFFDAIRASRPEAAGILPAEALATLETVWKIQALIA
jgi:predicted dehydrogenase